MKKIFENVEDEHFNKIEKFLYSFQIYIMGSNKKQFKEFYFFIFSFKKKYKGVKIDFFCV